MSMFGPRKAAVLTVLSSLGFAIYTQPEVNKRHRVEEEAAATPSFGGSSLSSTPTAAAAAPPPQPTAAAAAAPTKAAPPSIAVTAEALNASQDQAVLQKCLDGLKSFGSSSSSTSTPSCTVELYRLLGCPYCNKVDTLLDYYKVPHDVIVVDPLSFRHAPDNGYWQVPQLQFVVSKEEQQEAAAIQRKRQQAAATTPPPPTTTAITPSTTSPRGPYVVDSSFITKTLAGPLGFQTSSSSSSTDNNSDDRLSSHRDWITNTFGRTTFAAMNSTLRNAMETYTFTVPSYYQMAPLRFFGASGLYLLTRLKIIKSIETEMAKSSSGNGSGHTTRTTSPSLGSSSSPQDSSSATTTTTTPPLPRKSFWRLDTTLIPLVESNVATFLAWRPPAAAAAGKSSSSSSNMKRICSEDGSACAMRPATALFHGGDKPDLVDIEMFALTRPLLQHRLIGPQLLKDWGSSTSTKSTSSADLSSSLDSAEFKEWVTAMQAAIPESYGREVPLD